MTNWFKKTFSRLALMLGIAPAVLGCAAAGPTDNPLLRSLSRDRYVGGDDIARACGPGQPARYRLFYNAIEDRQQRSYDITALPEGGGMLETQVIGPPVLNDPRRGITVTDPIRPWRGETALYKLNPAELQQITAALQAAGFEQPVPEGLHLRGDSFFWTASACRDGRFHFHAWGYPSPEFDRMAEPLLDVMLGFDKTGVAAQRPYAVALPPYSTYFNVTDPEVIQRAPRRYITAKNGLRYSQGTIN